MFRRRAHERHRQEAEATQALRTRLASAQTALDSLVEGIIVFGSDGVVSNANAAARELIGRRFESTSELAPAPLREAVQRGEDASLEFETAGRTIRASVSPGGGDGSSASVVVLRDVTAARREARIRTDFVANASHELKTPVASIRALAEALRDAAGVDPPAVERMAVRLEDETVRLTRLLANLLDLSRLEAGRLPSSLVELDDVVAREVDRIRPRAEGAGIRMILEPPDRAVVAGSEGDLALLVHNLLDNAIRYSPDGGQIRTSLATQDSIAELTISDTGTGIASRDLDRIFERFYRADPARSRQTGGTGLGLSIVKHVVEAHGGDVQVQSVLGAGSTFTVRLPLADRAVA